VFNLSSLKLLGSLKPEYTAYAITLMGVMGVSAIAPALPVIAKAFGLTKIQAGILVMAFTLPGTIFSPVTGVMADRFGRKIVTSTAILIFGIFGFLCTFVNFRTMVIFRLIQGSSASALVALSTTIIGDSYTGIDREKIIGYNASILTTGIAFYQLTGGYLAHLNWKYPFYMFLLAVPTSIFVMVSPIPDIRCEDNFSEYASRVSKFFSRKILWLFATGMVAYAVLYGTFLTYLPFVIYKTGGNSIVVGAVQATMSLSTAIFAAKLTKISKKLGNKILPAGFLAYALALSGILASYFSGYELSFFIPSIIFGYAQGTVLPTLQNLIVSFTKKEGRATIMSTYGSVSKLGQTVGPLFFGLFTLDGVYISGILLTLAVSFLHVLKEKGFNITSSKL
jgi:MFS family permease